jgi:hypothetical protein
VCGGHEIEIDGQTRMLQARVELIVGQVAMVEDGARLRREYEILRNARNTLHERL